jgi:hypothetical protein
MPNYILQAQSAPRSKDKPKGFKNQSVNAV